jgi:hypothetical protein
MSDTKRAPEGWMSLSEIAEGPIPDGRLHSNLMNPDWQALFRLLVGSANQSQRILMEGLLTECTPIDEMKSAYGLAVVSLHQLRKFLVDSAASAEHAGIYAGTPELSRAYAAACHMFAVGKKKEAESGQEAYPIKSLAMIDAILSGQDVIKAVKDAEELARLVVERSAPKVLIPENPQPPVARLTFEPGTWTVVFDGKEYRIDNSRAFKIFKVIADANGDLVTSDTIRAKVPNCATRIDKVLADNLPEALRALVPGQRGPNSGYALKLPKKRVRNGAR